MPAPYEFSVAFKPTNRWWWLMFYPWWKRPFIRLAVMVRGFGAAG